MDAAPTIQFREDINILIGPNGSGKSNLLEIINKIFFHHFNTIYDLADAILPSTNSTDRAIRPNERRNNSANTVKKHFNHKDKPSLVRIVVTPDKGDLKNLTFLKNNWEELKEFSFLYSNESRIFQNEFDFSQISFTESSITFDISFDNSTHKVSFKLISAFMNDFEKLYYHYLQDFNLLQKLIEANNNLFKKNWEMLKNPFALISSMRQHGGFNTHLNMASGISEQLKTAYQSDGNNSTKNYSSTDTVFRLSSIRIAQELIANIYNKGQEHALNFAEQNENSILFKINGILKKNLGFTLKLESLNQAVHSANLVIYDGHQKIDFNDLSSGQKSIFFLLFTIYGFNIENGFLLIDEPELHLHAAMQTKYFSLLKEIQVKANLQIIIATHSAIFIDETTINNTYRFSKVSQCSKVTNTEIVNRNQRDLIKILTYTNSSRIFFSNKVLLVEGDSDEYFFRYYLDNYYLSIFPKEEAIEILNIGGKNNYEKWRTFLSLFQIPCYFIGDFDNVKDFKLIDSIGINYQKLLDLSKKDIIDKIFEEKIKPKPSKDGKAIFHNIDRLVKNNFRLNKSEKEIFRQLWQYLLEKQGIGRNHLIEYLHKKENKNALINLTNAIENEYQRRVFILKQGDLETYLGITGHKDSEKVINFCNKDFITWIKKQKKVRSPHNKLKEFNGIFDIIYA